MGGLHPGQRNVQPEPSLQLPVPGDAPVPCGQREGDHAGQQQGVPGCPGSAAGQPFVRLPLQERDEEGAAVSADLLDHPHGP